VKGGRSQLLGTTFLAGFEPPQPALGLGKLISKILMDRPGNFFGFRQLILIFYSYHSCLSFLAGLVTAPVR
jgi:hypothetical protein